MIGSEFIDATKSKSCWRIEKLTISEPLETAVVLIIFNRPSHTQRVFSAIEAARPKKLYLVSDGPRESVPGDVGLVEECRDIVSRVNWPCEVKTNFAQTNLGCRNRVVSGLDWVFSEVEEAIILEDDCLPSGDFFSFMSEMLKLYKNDRRIGSVSGSNSLRATNTQFGSYFFSAFPEIWGWGTWSRVWEKYDSSISSWPELRQTDLLEKVLRTSEGVRFWRSVLDDVHSEKIDTWDYQLSLVHWVENWLTVLPNVNLVSNIGFGADATHTLSSNNPFANAKVYPLELPLAHPKTVERHAEHDHQKELMKFAKPLSAVLLNRVFNKLPDSLRIWVRQSYAKIIQITN